MGATLVFLSYLRLYSSSCGQMLNHKNDRANDDKLIKILRLIIILHIRFYRLSNYKCLTGKKKHWHEEKNFSCWCNSIERKFIYSKHELFFPSHLPPPSFGQRVRLIKIRRWSEISGRNECYIFNCLTYFLITALLNAIVILPLIHRHFIISSLWFM